MKHPRPPMSTIRSHFEESAQLTQTLLNDERFWAAMEAASSVMIEALKRGHKIMSCGNGGSMCDAMHFAEELSGRYRDNRPALAAMAFSDPSTLTCIGNDYGFEQVFSRQVEALGKSGDVLVAISTSGNSKNVILGAKMAKKNGAKIISLTGRKNTQLTKLSDISIQVPSTSTPRIQEAHRLILHLICSSVEKNY